MDRINSKDSLVIAYIQHNNVTSSAVERDDDYKTWTVCIAGDVGRGRFGTEKREIKLQLRGVHCLSIGVGKGADVCGLGVQGVENGPRIAFEGS